MEATVQEKWTVNLSKKLSSQKVLPHLNGSYSFLRSQHTWLIRVPVPFDILVFSNEWLQCKEGEVLWRWGYRAIPSSYQDVTSCLQKNHLHILFWYIYLFIYSREALSAREIWTHCKHDSFDSCVRRIMNRYTFCSKIIHQVFKLLQFKTVVIHGLVNDLDKS